MPVIQPIIDLIDVFAQHGLTHAVISPGSRSAAVTLSVARNPAVQTIVSIDERSAGFIALGLALELQRPVAVVCTSGTAAYNLAPAVAEAYFQQVPLLVITADRPVEWVHQQDGQTIYQDGLFGRHVKKSLGFPADTTHPDSLWFANRVANETYLSADTFPKGPVHLNVPVREPFYPLENELFSPGPANRVIRRLGAVYGLSAEDWHTLQDEWEDTGRILIAGGQNAFSPELSATLGQITEEWEIPVLGDITANLGNHPDFISLQDVILQAGDHGQLRPDLLVTFGQSFLSKKFKSYIRKNPPLRHWHIGPGTHLVDSFQSLTLQVPVAPDLFFKKMLEDIDYKRFVEKEAETDDAYKRHWLKREYAAARVVNEMISGNITSLNDLSVIKNIVSELSEDVLLHLGNSMPVRHANLLRRLGLRQVVYANRGTSGIDGCVSTAIGSAAAAGEKALCLIVGDVSFLYDRNGFLLENLPANLKIIVLNNGGGNIFRLIDGPRRQPELGRFFETRHSFTAEATARDAGIAYYAVSAPGQFAEILAQFREAGGPALLEVFTDPEENRRIQEQIAGSRF